MNIIKPIRKFTIRINLLSNQFNSIKTLKMFYFKPQCREDDYTKYASFYTAAIEKGNAEALTFQAFVLYRRIYSALKGSAILMDFDMGLEMEFNNYEFSLPTDIMNRLKYLDRNNPIDLYQKMYHSIWTSLEAVAHLGWNSFFLQGMVRDALHFGTYKVSPKLKCMRDNYVKEYHLFISEFTSKRYYNCSYPKCTFKMTEASILIKCEKCISAKYCSKDCQLKDWEKEHWKKCGEQQTERESGISKNLRCLKKNTL